MSDLTVKAEALIAAVARAFYEDDAICLIDVLLRDKYLRDDDMGPRLNLQPKQLRKTLQFLQEEHMVKWEEVDDLSQGGSQQTKFWFIDYNQAVHTIRLRLFLLKHRLEKAELDARSSSYYKCPGFDVKRCNGRYTEEEAQQVVDPMTGLFLCQECFNAYESVPDPPELATYTLQLVDNAKDLKKAVDNMRRVHVQLSGKMIGSHQIRPSIYDLLQKVRVEGKDPLTSNLPSENFSLGIGSKRLAGTGRTAGIKAKKRAQQHQTAAAVGTTSRKDDCEIFLKNAIGQELRLQVEKGGGARAQLLATNRRRKRKLMDAAASRVGTDLPVHYKWKMKLNRRQEKTDEEEKQEKKSKLVKNLNFLEDNIGKPKRDIVQLHDADKEAEEPEENGHEDAHVILIDDTQEILALTDEERKGAFQAQYKLEIGRQAKLFHLEPDGKGPPKLSEEDEAHLIWEDCS